MIRGTTATFKFDLPHKLKYIREAKVVFWQDNYTGNPSGSLPLRKDYEPANTIAEGDPVGEKKELVVVLTSAETMLFTDQLKLRVQMRAINNPYDNFEPTAFGSHTELFTVYPLMNEIADGFPEDLPVTDGYITLDGDVVKADGAGVD